MPPLEWNAAIVRNDGAGAASVADVGRKKMDEEVDFLGKEISMEALSLGDSFPFFLCNLLPCIVGRHYDYIGVMN